MKRFVLIDVSHSIPLFVIDVGKLINKVGMYLVISFINLEKIFRNLRRKKYSLTHNASIWFSFVKSKEIRMWGTLNVIQIAEVNSSIVTCLCAGGIFSFYLSAGNLLRYAPNIFTKSARRQCDLSALRLEILGTFERISIKHVTG